MLENFPPFRFLVELDLPALRLCIANTDRTAAGGQSRDVSGDYMGFDRAAI